MKRKQLWEIIIGEGNTPFFVLFLQLFCNLKIILKWKAKKGLKFCYMRKCLW